MNALRILLVLLAVAVLGLLGWRLTADPQQLAGMAPVPLPSLPVPHSVSPPTASTETSEERLSAVPEFANFYGKLKTDFPHDYAAVLAQLTGVQQHDTDHSGMREDALIWEALRDLQQDQGVLASLAGSAALDGYFDARLAMLDSLAPLNARDCVDFLYGMTDAAITDFTASHHGLVATLAERQLAAIEDGRSRHGDRAVPTDADFTALSAALAARQVTPQEIALLLDGATPDPPVPDRRLCDLGRVYLNALRGLPADARQRVYGLAAELLARS